MPETTGDLVIIGPAGERNIRHRLDEHDRGKFLVSDIETGAHELDSDQLAAVERAREKRPGGPFYVLRIGYPTAFRLGRKALALPC